MERLPYKQYAETNELNHPRGCGVHARDHKESWFSALERPANAGLAQSVERDPYTVDVAGSSPAARTNPTTLSKRVIAGAACESGAEAPVEHGFAGVVGERTPAKRPGRESYPGLSSFSATVRAAV